ncbi:MAG: rRNA (adenine1518-N6/adenine1519-N6)-dimethyltransferase [Patescibacteria group bacterium]|nr:rRNA (adenine1518-N6/adenine1519-N6)-dimethyltransferase [Patescibacteria group bacterium]
MKAKKHLGQNFLKSGKALRDIVLAAKISEKDIVVEIGPGKGALTEKVLESAGKVIAIEKDRDLIPILEEKFQEEIKSKKLTLLEDDVLTFDLSKLPKNYKIVANIPFYITGAILEKFLESKNQPSVMALIVQKEVAERVVARDGKESILSMSVRVFGDPKFIGKIPARYFSPEPKVDSAILLIENIKNTLKDNEKDVFFKFVKAGFSQKRKTLLKNLTGLGLKRELLEEKFKELCIDPTIRAEKLSLEMWLSLIKSF